jgi:hypothetical protein
MNYSSTPEMWKVSVAGLAKPARISALPIICFISRVNTDEAGTLTADNNVPVDPPSVIVAAAAAEVLVLVITILVTIAPVEGAVYKVALPVVGCPLYIFLATVAISHGSHK